MKPKLPITVLFLLLSLPLTTPLRPISPSSPCKTRHDPIHLRSDQITVLINGYSSSRLHLLLPIATTYASNPIVAAVLILWSNPTTPSETLTNFSLNLSLYSSSAPISILRHPTASLNSRFLPRSLITSRAVVICDDDIEIDPQSFNFAFKIWQLNQDRLIGFFSRSHDLDIPTKTWMYNIHPNKYSIILTKFMILKTEYLHKYSCTNGHNQAAEGLKWVEMRKMVDEKMNCEDILMNFLVADESNSGPILVEAKSLRDFGDARNDEERERVKEVGLSSRRSEHRKRRGECIREFHKVLGRMPLKYNYGKVVNSVGEQGLCTKGGKLVFCDQQVLV